MSVGTVTTQVKNLSPGDKFLDQGHWYAWQSIDPKHPDDPRRLAYFLEPNLPTGLPTANGHWVDEESQVEAVVATPESNPDKYFEDFGAELDEHPIGAGLPRSTGG